MVTNSADSKGQIPEQHNGSDDNHSSSFHGKPNWKEDPLGVLSTVPDPDEPLSDEERGKLVSGKVILPATANRLLRRKGPCSKLDLYLIPWLCLLYLISFLDRTNIGNAKIEGLQDDLNMTNNEYNNTRKPRPTHLLAVLNIRQ